MYLVINQISILESKEGEDTINDDDVRHFLFESKTQNLWEGGRFKVLPVIISPPKVSPNGTNMIWHIGVTMVSNIRIKIVAVIEFYIYH